VIQKITYSRAFARWQHCYRCDAVGWDRVTSLHWACPTG